MADTNDDIDAIILRTRAVEDEIEAARARIDKLLGVGANASLFSRRWRERFVTEVRHELPAIELPAAHEALVEAMHRETGMVGAVKRRGDELEWKPFLDQRSAQNLEIHLEGDADAPTLRVRGSASSPTRQVAFATGLAVGIMAVVGLAVALTKSGLVAGLTSLFAVALFLFLGARFVRAGATRRLSALAHRLEEATVNARPRVRVASPSADADQADEALVFEAEHAMSKETRRGVS